MSEWIWLVPGGDSFGPLRYKIVTALVPHRNMLGPKHLAACARRMHSNQWEVRYATKRFWQKWPEFPRIKKAMIGSLTDYWYVRETEVLADSLQVEAEFFGEDVRVVGYDRLSHEPWLYAQEIGRFLRRIWYLRTDDPLDGIDRQPDETCVSPRGHSLAYRRIPKPGEIEHAANQLAKHLADRQAIAEGKVSYLGQWMTPEEYKATRNFEEANRLR